MSRESKTTPYDEIELLHDTLENAKDESRNNVKYYEDAISTLSRIEERLKHAKYI